MTSLRNRKPAAHMHRANVAAVRYLRRWQPRYPWGLDVGPEKPRNIAQAGDLIIAAFTLYALSWGPSYDIADWDWPFFGLEAGKRVEYIGEEPWTVLFRRAMDLACPPQKRSVRRVKGGAQ